jgi:type I restriction enzyme R subunit
LIGLGYQSVKVMDGNALVSDLKTQLEAFNKTDATDKEFDGILHHLAKGNVFEKAKPEEIVLVLPKTMEK